MRWHNPVTRPKEPAPTPIDKKPLPPSKVEKFHRVPSFSRGHKSYTEEQRIEVLRLYDQVKWTYQEIAEKTGVKYTTVGNIVHLRKRKMAHARWLSDQQNASRGTPPADDSSIVTGGEE